MAETKVGMFVYATITPVKYEMDVPSNSERKDASKKDLETLWREATNYGSNGRKRKKSKTDTQKGEKSTPEGTKTTLATEKVEITKEHLIGFKAKVQTLPAMYGKACMKAGGSTSNNVVDAEIAVRDFKMFASKRLKLAVEEGVTGYDAIVKVINEINEKAITLVKVEFFLKRVDVSEFSGSNPGKDGKHYMTRKVRKFFTTLQPTVEMLTEICQKLKDESIVSYNEDWVLKESVEKSSSGEVKSAIRIQRVGYELSSDEDKVIADRLTLLRNPNRKKE